MPFRLKGGLPKVGIRPTIDGRRRGVRESLEGQTKALALGVAKLIKGSLRHPSGEALEVVVAQTTIGGAAEAARCEELFQRENVGLSLTVTPCWCYGTETIDTDPLRPKAIWGFNGTERPGAVYLAAATAGHDQMGLPVFGIYGQEVMDPQDNSLPPDVREKILSFVKAGLGVATMRGKSYLSVGGVSMGIAGSVVSSDFFRDYLGMGVEYCDMVELLRRVEEGIYDQEELEQAWGWVQKNCQVEGGFSNREEQWAFLLKMTLILRDLMVGNPRLTAQGFGEEGEGHNALLAGFQGQRQWTDYKPNGDFAETILNSSFDWHGPRQPYLVATENDSLNGVAMLFGHLLTGTAQVFCDVRTYWSFESVKKFTGQDLKGKAWQGMIHLINSGSAALDGTGAQRDSRGRPVLKPYWEIGEEEVENCLGETRFYPAVGEYFRGGGFSTSFKTQGEMPVTLTRLNLVKGLGPVLQIAEGYTVALDPEIHQILDQRTNPTWPTTWFVPILTGRRPFNTVYSVMDHWGANHGALSYGHIGGDLIVLASLLRIPVGMHNVREERIMRPTAWSSFGTADLEGADFRACGSYGPLYRKVAGRCC